MIKSLFSAGSPLTFWLSDLPELQVSKPLGNDSSFAIADLFLRPLLPPASVNATLEAAVVECASGFCLLQL